MTINSDCSPRIGFVGLAIGLAVGLLVGCGSPQSPEPEAAASKVTPEIAAAPGRIFMQDGRVLPADDWWESGTLMFYRWHGDQQMVLKDQIARIEGEPRPTRVIVGPVETRSTLGSVAEPN